MVSSLPDVPYISTHEGWLYLAEGVVLHPQAPIWFKWRHLSGRVRMTSGTTKLVDFYENLCGSVEAVINFVMNGGSA